MAGFDPPSELNKMVMSRKEIMSDQCQYCTMRRNFHNCRQTPCSHHENWVSHQWQEENKRLRECLNMALEWIDAVPSETPLPVMPGFDRDYVDSVLAGMPLEEQDY